MFKDESLLDYTKLFSLNKCLQKKKTTLNFKLRKIYEKVHYFVEEIKGNDLMSKKHKKVCTSVNQIEQLLILVSTIIELVSVFAFVSLVGIPIGITSSAIGLKFVE